MNELNIVVFLLMVKRATAYFVHLPFIFVQKMAGTMDRTRNCPISEEAQQGCRDMDDDRKKSENDERKTAKEQDDYLEEALEETFPASDPIAPGHVDKAPSDKK
jgi:hypothetical protein